MRLGDRLGRLERAAGRAAAGGDLLVVTAIPVGGGETRPPGLYREARVGCLAGTLVFDPAAGDPVLPAGAGGPHTLLIVLGPDAVGPDAGDSYGPEG